MESLDYYTTLRVKYAYLRMNADALHERLCSLRQRIERIHSLLILTPSDITKEWVMPTGCGGQIDNDDPNSLCVPQEEDYSYSDVAESHGSAPTFAGHNGGEVGICATTCTIDAAIDASH